MKAFNPAGRTQDEWQAREIDDTLSSLLVDYGVDFRVVRADFEAPLVIAKQVMQVLEERSGVSYAAIPMPAGEY